MSLRPMFSGTYMNHFVARYSSSAFHHCILFVNSEFSNATVTTPTVTLQLLPFSKLKLVFKCSCLVSVPVSVLHSSDDAMCE